MSTLVAYAGLGTTELLAIVLIVTLKWVLPILIVIFTPVMARKVEIPGFYIRIVISDP